MIQEIAMIGSIALPLCNIPLMYNIIRRKSSKDVSMAWAVGVWTCLAMMTPSGLVSPDLVWKVFTIVNFGLFTCVLVTVLIYRGGKKY